MFPQHLLNDISPATAKLYLTLLTFADSNATPIQIPHTQLAQLSGIAPRTCSLALSRLIHLGLISRSPSRYHTPATLHLTQIPAHPNAPLPTPAHSHAPLTRSPAHPNAPLSNKTPFHTPKNPLAHPQTTLLNKPSAAPRGASPCAPLPTPPTPPTPGHSLADFGLPNDATLKTLFQYLPPTTQQSLIAKAQATLARLNTQQAPQSRGTNHE